MRPRKKRSRLRVSVSALCLQAVRALFRNKMRSALSALGITIGTAAVVWVVAIGKAGSQRAQDELLKLGDNLVWVEAGSRNVNGVRTGAQGAATLRLEDAEAILREVPLIRRVSPQVDGSTVAVSATANWTTRYRGVAPDYLPIKRWEVAAGVTFSDEQVERADNVCLIGETVRQRLFGQEEPVGQVIRIAAQPFEVVGVLGAKGQSGSGQDQDDTIFMPYTTALRKLQGNKIPRLDDIVCTATSPETVAPAAALITDLMRQRHRIEAGREDDFNIRHPEEVVNAQLEASRTFALLLISIASVALLVGGIGIMNVMLASVTERTREIGIRLAVGAPSWAVQLQFLAEAVILCVLGGLLGALLSVAGSWAITRVLGWPLSVPVEAVTVAVGFSIVVGVIFGFFPARRAAGLDPIVALRDE
jgi:putative ABC transport system permease protein